VVGRAHGLHGDVAVDLRTDEPEVRFAPGAVLGTEGSTSTLTVAAMRDGAAGRLVVRFVEAPDRTRRRSARTRPHFDLTAHDRPAGDDPEEYYDRQLRGLRILDADATTSASSRTSSSALAGHARRDDGRGRAARTVRLRPRRARGPCSRTAQLSRARAASSTTFPRHDLVRDAADASRRHLDLPDYLSPLSLSLVGKAIASGWWGLGVHDLRDWTHDRTGPSTTPRTAAAPAW